MIWKIYSGEPFEGERIFKFGNGNIEKAKYHEIESWIHGWIGAKYLDESPSFSIEDMREAYYAGFEKAGESFVERFDEWLKQREGK
jgi:hypothetical protein